MSTDQGSTREKANPRIKVPEALVVSVGKEFCVPLSVRTNVWSFDNDDGMLWLRGVVSRDLIKVGDTLILVSSLAPVLGIFNPDRDMLAAAHGKPVFKEAWRIEVEHISKPYAMTGSNYYETIETSDTEEYKPTVEELR